MTQLYVIRRRRPATLTAAEPAALPTTPELSEPARGWQAGISGEVEQAFRDVGAKVFRRDNLTSARRVRRISK